MTDQLEQRRPGRPRSTASRSTEDPIDEIMRVAGELFAEGGYPSVTMAEVARRVGLRQPSLYYYFPNRAQLFAAFVSRSYIAGLDLVGQIAAEGGPPVSQLRKFIEGDVALLCSLPFAVIDINRVAIRDRDSFSAYWRDRNSLERALAAIIRAGCREGAIRPVSPLRTAQLVLLTDDAAQAWYLEGRSVTPRVLAAEVADLTTSGLLA